MQCGCEFDSCWASRFWLSTRYNLISINVFDTQVFTPLYAQGPTTITDKPIHSHRLSLMFMVFVIGLLMNTSLPVYNWEAEKTTSSHKPLYSTHNYIWPAHKCGSSIGTGNFPFHLLTRADTHTVPDGVLSLLGQSTWDKFRSLLGYHGYRCKGQTECKLCYLQILGAFINVDPICRLVFVRASSWIVQLRYWPPITEKIRTAAAGKLTLRKLSSAVIPSLLIGQSSTLYPFTPSSCVYPSFLLRTLTLLSPQPMNTARPYQMRTHSVLKNSRHYHQQYSPFHKVHVDRSILSSHPTSAVSKQWTTNVFLVCTLPLQPSSPTQTQFTLM